MGHSIGDEDYDANWLRCTTHMTTQLGSCAFGIKDASLMLTRTRYACVRAVRGAGWHGTRARSAAIPHACNPAGGLNAKNATLNARSFANEMNEEDW